MESEENAERQANSLDHGPGIKSEKSELQGEKFFLVKSTLVKSTNIPELKKIAHFGK